MITTLTDTQKTYIRGWVAALRSGKYQQGLGCLRSLDDKFCCLGVLCDLGMYKAWVRGSSAFLYRGYDGTLPDEVRYTVGLDYSDVGALMALNDRYGKSFEEIADYLEATYLGD